MSHIITVQVDKQTAAVSQVGFGTPMLMSTEAAVDNRFTGTAKLYASLDELGSTGDNYDTAGVTYKMAQTLFGQNPRVTGLVVGKRSSSPLMTVDLTPVVIDSTAYVVTIGGEVFTFTSGVATTNLLIVAGLLGLINAGSQNVLASGTTTLKIESAATPGGAATAGKPYTIDFDKALFASQNVTTDPGVAADLSAIRGNIDGNDDWYALLCDSFGVAEIVSLSAAIEVLPRIYVAATFDTDVYSSSTTDIGSALQASNYDRTALISHDTPLSADMAAAILGRNLPTDPGSITWMFKDVAGPKFNIFTGSQQGFLTAKNVNNYVREFGNNFFQFGTMASGEFIDVTRGIDFFVARLMEAIFSTLKNAPKIPMTNKGIAEIEAAVRGVTELGVDQGIFLGDPAPVITMPDISGVSTVDRANRFLDNVIVEAQLAGAIHSVAVKVIVTV